MNHSVFYEEKCPNCQGVMGVDLYLQSGEEFRLCRRCGTSDTYKVKREEDGSLVLDDENKPVYIHEYKVGYGVFVLKNTGTHGYCMGVLHEEASDEIKQQLLDEIKKPERDYRECFISLWNQEKKEQEILFGEVPAVHSLSFEAYEYYCQTRNE